MDVVSLITVCDTLQQWRQAPQLAVETYRKVAAETQDMPVKEAYSAGLRRVGELLNYFPGKYPGGIPNAPSPLTAMLSTGLVGAGLGYGAGTVGEWLLPRQWQRGKLQKTLATLGGLAGAVPGAAWMASNYSADAPLNDNSLLDVPRPEQGVKTSKFDKLAADYVSQAGFGPPLINVNEFNQVVWGDPRVAGQIPVGTQAAASGLLTAASEASGSPIITPLDIARITVGMGTGYLSGAIVGKALGTLVGLPYQTQERLKNVGLYAGIIRAVVPIAFGD